jgi:hypothetical protein
MTGEPILSALTADQHLARYWSVVSADKIGSPVMRFIIRFIICQSPNRGILLTGEDREQMSGGTIFPENKKKTPSRPVPEPALAPKEGLFLFNNTKEGPRAPVVKPGRIIQAWRD